MGAIPGTINPNTTSGTQLATILNDFVGSFASMNKSDTRDPNLSAGGMWVDDTDEGSGLLYLKLYDGSDDIILATFDIDNNAIQISGSSDSFAITKISDDTNGAEIQLIKKRETGGGQTLEDDELGEVIFKGSDASSVLYTMAKILAASTDDVTSSTRGSVLDFYTTKDGLSSMTRKMRILGDGKVGIGTINPGEKLEVYATEDVAIKVKRVDATANPARRVVSKKRVADNGQTKASDIISRDEFKGHDQNGAEVDLAKIEVKALENTTDAAQESEINFSVKGNGETSFTEVLKLKKDGIEFQGQSFNEYSDSDSLAHSGIEHTLFSVDGSVYTAFEATLFARGADAGDQRTIKYVINGYYDGSNWLVTKNHETLEGDKLLNISYTDAETIIVKYLNNLIEGSFVGGNWFVKVRRFA